MNSMNNTASIASNNYPNLEPGAGYLIERFKLKPSQSKWIDTPINIEKKLLITKGRAWVTLQDAEILVSQGDSIDIDFGESYKVESIGPKNLEFAEFQRVGLSKEIELDELEDQLIRMNS